MDPASLYPLLDAAEAALKADRLTAAPGEESAHALYTKVLRLDPGNQEALRGNERIVERFVELALEAADGWQLARARSMLARARLIDPTHPSIEPTQSQVALLSRATREVNTFDQAAISTSDSRALLARMGKTAKLYDCRAKIRAKSDAQGRWMYQQMNRAPGEARVRASMAVGLPAQVELICFHDS